MLGKSHLLRWRQVIRLTLRSVILLDSGELPIPRVGAGQRIQMSLPDHIFSYQSPDEVFLTISFRLRSATPWADASHEVAWWQRKLSPSQPASIKQPALLPCDELRVRNSQAAVQVTGSNWALQFDRVRGYITN